MRSKGTRPGSSGDDQQIAIRRDDAGPGTVVLVISGDLDLGSAPALKWALSDEVRAGARRLVLDLSEVGFMDSTAIGVLVGIRRSLPDGGLALTSLRPGVRKTLEITGLDRSFPIFDALQDALAAQVQAEDRRDNEASSG